jgi:aminoglycoside-2''-adenylyltransferase
MQMSAAVTTLDPVSRDFYQSAIRYLHQAGIPFLIGGAYSYARHTALERHTKDFDIFVRPEDHERVLRTLASAGYSVELTFPHWLGKAFSGDNCIDVIFSSGNGVARVDDGWFEHAIHGQVFDIDALLCPVEETIWSKAFVMERERFDGGDIAHLIRGSGRDINWQRLLDRFGPHWRVLLSHLVMFGFCYPSERDIVPAWVLDELMNRLRKETASPPSPERICQGTLLSRSQYLVDIEQWGYLDARIAEGTMEQDDIDLWTDAIATEQPTQVTRPTYRSE